MYQRGSGRPGLPGGGRRIWSSGSSVALISARWKAPREVEHPSGLDLS
jgi:hypothetical protein